jgi:hypothetical protein
MVSKSGLFPFFKKGCRKFQEIYADFAEYARHSAQNPTDSCRSELIFRQYFSQVAQMTLAGIAVSDHLCYNNNV